MQHPDRRRTAPGELGAKVSSPLLILFRVGPDITAECSGIAADASIGLAKVKHLFAACAAVQTSVPRRLMVIGSEDTKWWDRAILEEHVARVDASLRWVSETTSAIVARDLLAWAVAASLPPRFASIPGRLPRTPARSPSPTSR